MALLDDLLSGMLGKAIEQQPAGRQPMDRQPAGDEMGRQAPTAGDDMGGILMALLPVVLSMLASRGGRQNGPGPKMDGRSLNDVLGQVLSDGGRGDDNGINDILGQVL